MLKKFGLMLISTAAGACSTHHKGSSPAPAPAETDSANASAYVASAPDYLTLTTNEIEYLSTQGVVVMPGTCVATKLQVGGDGVEVAMNEPVHLSSSSASGAFYSDAACTNQIKDVNVTVNGAVAYYRDQTGGHATLTAADGGSLKLSSAALNLTVSEATSLTFSDTHGAQLGTWTQAAAACSAVAFQVLAGSGPVALKADTAFSLSSSSSTGAFYKDSSCSWPITSLTVSAGNYQSAANALLFYRDSTAGVSTLTVESAALPGVKSASLATTVN